MSDESSDGPNNKNPGKGNMSVIDGRVAGGGWADPQNTIRLHGFNQTGLSVPGSCAVNCTNNNEAFAFHHGGANFVFGDWSVHFPGEVIDIGIYAALITCAGGQVVSGNQY